MIQEHFNIDRIIGITVCGERKSSNTWLPRKQKTWFFGLFKRNAWHSEGWYSYGCYEECYESGCWDATPSTKKQLESYGYIVKDDKTVWHKPYVTVYLEAKLQVSRTFDTLKEAKAWVEELKVSSNKPFVIVEK